jgi:hypothetical protein
MFCLQDGAVGWKPQHFEKQPDGSQKKFWTGIIQFQGWNEMRHKLK